MRRKNMSEHTEIHPSDIYNEELVKNTHPADWVNPKPEGRYNLVVLGAGAAGLVTSAVAAGLGARVALVEKSFMGGDCLIHGCVPSKALIRAARAAADVRRAPEYGVRVGEGVEVDFGAVMERMRRLRARISPNDSAERFRSLGVDVYLGEGRFTSPHTLEVGGETLRFKKAVVATGARAAELPIPGLADVGYLTNETVFWLRELPRRLAVIGAGPIGCELAQSFRRFGAEVTLLEVMPQILIREDRDAARIVEAALRNDGIEILTECETTGMERRGEEKVLHVKVGGEARDVVVDEILLGVGRAPNVEGIGLEAAGVEIGRQGVQVDDRLRTTAGHIYAAGDVCTPYKFTHMADAMAKIVVKNALFGGRARMSALHIPWCTYTDPEIAHVGMYEADAEKAGLEVDTYMHGMADVDRAILESEDEGFVKVHTRRGTDRIVGATIVSRHAGEMISEVTLAMVGGLGLSTIGNTIHPYPTQAEGILRTAHAYSRTRLTPLLKRLFEGWMRLTR